MQPTRSPGTDVRSGIDAHALSRAVERPGIDTRAWVMEGTVCTLDRNSGDFDYTDHRAVWNDSGGVHVDVLLSNGHHVTARYAGIQAGDVTILAPIRPGDPVVVVNPGGSLMVPVVVAILHTRSNRQPTANRVPIFDNYRLLMYANTVPIDIRTAGGVQVLLDQQGNVTVTASTTNLGGSDQLHPVPQGDLQQTALNDLATALQTYIAAIQPIADPSGSATATLGTAISAFLAAQYLSAKVNTQ